MEKAQGAPGRAQQASVGTVELERAGVAPWDAGQSVQVSLLAVARGQGGKVGSSWHTEQWERAILVTARWQGKRGAINWVV